MTPGATFERYIQTFFAGQVETTYPGTFILFPNGPKNYPKNAHWVRFHVISGDSYGTLGKDKVKTTTEVVHITVYAPEGEGARTARDMAETMAKWFELAQMQIEGRTHYIKFRTAIIKQNEDPSSGLHRCIATIDGWRYEPLKAPS